MEREIGLAPNSCSDDHINDLAHVLLKSITSYQAKLRPSCENSEADFGLHM